MVKWPGLIEHYRKFLPVSEKTPPITLGEGNTPLIFANNLSEELGLKLFFKYEGLNPTGSFKDRGMTMAISRALEEGSKAVMCASTGNTSASAAAYSAKAGMDCIVLIPGGKIALGKLSQALMHGAKVLSVNGNFDQALKIVRVLTEKHPITLVNSVNQFRIEGQKTAAFEICDQLDGAPDYLFIPVGNAGNIISYWAGFNEYRRAGLSKTLPKMMGFQAAGAAPIVLGHPIEHPETLATAIRIGNPARWDEAIKARDESGGMIGMVTDDEIIAAYKLIAAKEGIFAEPASAASVAGLLKSVKENAVLQGATVVSVLTGHGLKDPDNAMEHSRGIIEVDATIESVERAIFGPLL